MKTILFIFLLFCSTAIFAQQDSTKQNISEKGLVEVPEFNKEFIQVFHDTTEKKIHLVFPESDISPDQFKIMIFRLYQEFIYFNIFK